LKKKTRLSLQTQDAPIRPWWERIPWDNVNKYAKKYGIDPKVIGAIIHVESACNPYLLRYEPTYRYTYFPRELAENLGLTIETMIVCQKTSYGPMQVMYAVALELGFKGLPTELCNFDAGVEFGTKVLFKKKFKYGDDPILLAASYNAGEVRKKESGLFENQRYVDRFDLSYRKLVELSQSGVITFSSG